MESVRYCLENNENKKMYNNEMAEKWRCDSIWSWNNAPVHLTSSTFME
jgi:hypothetical protein